ncbi:MAG: phosphoenolpyruvate synthase [Candidatus Melainabacteria bacterium]|nr:MAG: phosphoenolpyruvate synthase [Candidatus Melainabacteria bacterium]
MKNIILEYEQHNAGLTGNKAANLARLKAAGFAVPEFVTIVPGAFRSDTNWQDPLLEEELKIAHEKFNVGNTLLAVRSSAIDEDGAKTSFAGQLDTFLNVSSEWVITAARSVWLSGTTDRLQAYCNSMGIERKSNGPAIIVQKMVDAKIAGVVFSADPVSGNRNTVVINAVGGLADKLVSGAVSGELLYVFNGQTIERDFGVAGKSEVSDAIALEIACIARKIEFLFGCPQDIEWAHDGNQLFILQARPITTLPEQQMQLEGNLRIWDNSNISESYQGVTTPLTFSFAAKAYEHVYIQFCRLMGVSNERIEANYQIFPRMLGFIRGRIYYNLVNWYKLLALLPGFQVNRPFMEQMMGVKEELPAEVIEQVIAENHVSTGRAYLNFAKSLCAITIRFANLRKEIAGFQNHFNTTLSGVPKDLSKLNVDQLAKLYRGLEGRLLSSWDAPLVNDFFAMVFFGLLNSLSQKWMPPSFSRHELLVNAGGIISAEPAKLIAELADITRDDLELQQVLTTGSMYQIENLMKRNERFEVAFRNYLARFGDRCFNELKLESPTLNDNPLPLLRNIGAMASAPAKERTANLPRSETRSKAQIAKLPCAKRVVFNFVADQAVERIRWRENLRFERTRLFGLVRRIFLQFGKQLEQQGLLKNKNDIFYLEVEEVLNFVEGKATTSNIAALIELRRKEFIQFQAELPPPNRIVTRQPVIEAAVEAAVETTVGSTPCVDRFESSLTGRETSNTNKNAYSTLTGLGCSPGFVRGRVRVVRDPSTAKPLEDEILIAERTDPGWIVLFSQAKGIIVEYGSLLSHTAIVSRELGIPAIVSASGVMNWLADGDTIEFDGRTGAITKLSDSTKTENAQLQSSKLPAASPDENAAAKSEHDLSDNVVKLIESIGLRREAS